MDKKDETPQDQQVRHIQPFEKVVTHMRVSDIVYNNFIGGVSWALGATIGLSLIIALLTLAAEHVNFNLIPVVGTFISQVVDYVLANNQNLHK